MYIDTVNLQNRIYKFITMSDDHIIGKLSSDKTDGMVDENTKAWYASIGQESAN